MFMMLDSDVKQVVISTDIYVSVMFTYILRTTYVIFQHINASKNVTKSKNHFGIDFVALQIFLFLRYGYMA